MDNLFKKSLFIDIGSAILYANGAPTVRNIFEDQEIVSNLSLIVASDINDKRSAKTRFIDIYRKSSNQLPFPVKEIPMLINKPDQVNDLLSNEGVDKNSPVIIRSSHSGPDLFYSRKEQKQHLQAIAEATVKRNLFYMFERFLLFKAAGKKTYQWVGSFNQAGYAFTGLPWTRIEWNRRRLSEAFKINNRYLQKIKCRKK